MKARVVIIYKLRGLDKEQKIETYEISHLNDCIWNPSFFHFLPSSSITEWKMIDATRIISISIVPYE